MFDVITCGSSTVDVFLRSESETIDIKTRESEEELIAYPLGSKLLVEDIDFMIGGGGTNTAFTFSKSGLKTGYCGVIGRDITGFQIHKFLEDEDIEFLGTPGEKSGFSVILDSIEHNRTILAYKGSNNHLRYEDLDLSQLETEWFYFTSMVGESFQTLKKLARNSPGAKIAFNPSNYLCEEGIDFLKEILALSEVLILNKEEAKLLAGEKSLTVLLKKLSSTGPDTVCITEGSEGVHVLNKDSVYFGKPLGEAEEATGAGDAFGSGFVSGLVKEEPLEKSMLRGMLNAESVIQERGAKRGVLGEEELKELMNQPGAEERLKEIEESRRPLER